MQRAASTNEVWEGGMAHPTMFSEDAKQTTAATTTATATSRGGGGEIPRSSITRERPSSMTQINMNEYSSSPVRKRASIAAMDAAPVFRAAVKTQDRLGAIDSWSSQIGSKGATGVARPWHAQSGASRPEDVILDEEELFYLSLLALDRDRANDVKALREQRMEARKFAEGTRLELEVSSQARDLSVAHGLGREGTGGSNDDPAAKFRREDEGDLDWRGGKGDRALSKKQHGGEEEEEEEEEEVVGVGGEPESNGGEEEEGEEAEEDSLVPDDARILELSAREPVLQEALGSVRSAVEKREILIAGLQGAVNQRRQRLKNDRDIIDRMVSRLGAQIGGMSENMAKCVSQYEQEVNYYWAVQHEELESRVSSRLRLVLKQMEDNIKDTHINRWKLDKEIAKRASSSGTFFSGMVVYFYIGLHIFALGISPVLNVFGYGTGDKFIMWCMGTIDSTRRALSTVGAAGKTQYKGIEEPIEEIASGRNRVSRDSEGGSVGIGDALDRDTLPSFSSPNPVSIAGMGDGDGDAGSAWETRGGHVTVEESGGSPSEKNITREQEKDRAQWLSSSDAAGNLTKKARGESFWSKKRYSLESEFAVHGISDDSMFGDSSGVGGGDDDDDDDDDNEYANDADVKDSSASNDRTDKASYDFDYGYDYNANEDDNDEDW